MGFRKVSDLSEYSVSELLDLIEKATKLVRDKLDNSWDCGASGVSSSGYSVVEPETAGTSSSATEEASEQSTSDSDVELEEESVPHDVEPVLRYFINGKSLVIHCERSAGLLRCGRKVSPHFVVVYELHGIRCSRCFDV